MSSHYILHKTFLKYYGVFLPDQLNTFHFCQLSMLDLAHISNSISFRAGMGALWSVIGVIGAVVSLASKRSIAIVAGVIMLISAFGGLLTDSISIFYGLSFILLLIARKDIEFAWVIPDEDETEKLRLHSVYIFVQHSTQYASCFTKCLNDIEYHLPVNKSKIIGTSISRKEQ